MRNNANDPNSIFHPAIPLELQERIISDMGWQDGLIEASLVCQKWYPAVMKMYWAHRGLKIDGTSKSQGLRTLLKDPKCRFIHHVQHLVIDGKVTTGDDIYRVIDNVLDLLPDFPVHPQSIQLKELRYSWLFPRTIASIESFKDVSSLELHHVTYTNYGEFFNFLSAFSGLRNLSIGRSCLSLLDPEEPLYFTLPNLHSLQQLDIKIDTTVKAVIDILLTRPFPVEILKVDWGLQVFTDRETMAALLRHIGPTLKFFYLDATAAAGFECEFNLKNFPFRLTDNTNLEYFSAEPIFIRAVNRYDSTWVEDLVRSINSPSFQYLRLGIFLCYSGNMEQPIPFEYFDWGSLDDAIVSSSYFSHWRTVETCVLLWKDFPLPGNEDVESLLREKLPRLDGSGKMIVTKDTFKYH